MNAPGEPRAKKTVALLAGEALRRYVDDVCEALAGARLNAHYPASRPLVSHVECLGPQIHGGLYDSVEVDLRSGLPTYKEWVRVQADAAIAPDALHSGKPRELLETKARSNPTGIHGKRLLSRDYHTRLQDRPLAALDSMEVALRRIEPKENTAYFNVVLDKLDASGTFVRYTIDLSQESSAWNKPMVTLNDETAGHTEGFKSLIFRFTSLDSEFTFAKLVSIGGLKVERVVKGTVGPFFFSGMTAPAGVREMLSAVDGYVATFSIDMAAIDLARDKDNDPLDQLLAARLSHAARTEYEAARERHGYRVFKDRKFVIPRDLKAPLRALCDAAGTRNVVYHPRRRRSS